jgi:hypothetical protein
MESSPAPMASIMDERMHMYEYVLEQAMTDDAYPNPYAIEAHMNMEEYMGTVVCNEEMPRVSGVDGNRTISKLAIRRIATMVI